ncbi:MAG: hypothetical protein KDA87_23730, partial [Planctomycetales bacterium]|nr:hypothetical protein [Planctomycetales bacterium]
MQPRIRQRRRIACAKFFAAALLVIVVGELVYNGIVTTVRNVVVLNQRIEFWENADIPHRFDGETAMAKFRRRIRSKMIDQGLVRRYLSSGPVSSIDWLAFFPEIEEVNLRYGISGPVKLNPIGHCVSLKEFTCPYSDISDLSALQGLRFLHTLDVRCSLIDNLDALSELPLKNLDVSQTQLESLQPLSEISTLVKLRVSGCKIQDWSSLSNLTELVELDLSGADIADVAPISSLTSLIELNLAATQIHDV